MTIILRKIKSALSKTNKFLKETEMWIDCQLKNNWPKLQSVKINNQNILFMELAESDIGSLMYT